MIAQCSFVPRTSWLVPPRAERSWPLCKRAAPKGFWRRWIRLVRSRRNRTCRPMPISDLTPKHHSQTPLDLFEARKSLCARSSWESIIRSLGGPELVFFPSLSVSRSGGGSPRISTSNPGTAGSGRGRNLNEGNPASKIMGNNFYWAPISLPIARLPASTQRTAHRNTCCSSYSRYKQSSYVCTWVGESTMMCNGTYCTYSLNDRIDACLRRHLRLCQCKCQCLATRPFLGVPFFFFF
jgi:hypothetical protein